MSCGVWGAVGGCGSAEVHDHMEYIGHFVCADNFESLCWQQELSRAVNLTRTPVDTPRGVCPHYWLYGLTIPQHVYMKY